MSKTAGRPTAPDGSLRAALQTLPDVRRGQGEVHPLDGMLALAVCAVLCGCRSLYAISQWGRECAPAIRVALGLRAERGPSVATVHRAFRRLDHAAFERVLGQWCVAHGLAPDDALAIDGKTLRGLHGASTGRSCGVTPISWPTAEQPQHLCLDAGYDDDLPRFAAEQRGSLAHIRPRGEERASARSTDPAKKPRRWVVERLHSWLTRSRHLLVRWEQLERTYLAFVQLACARCCFRFCYRLRQASAA